MADIGVGHGQMDKMADTGSQSHLETLFGHSFVLATSIDLKVVPGDPRDLPSQWR